MYETVLVKLSGEMLGGADGSGLDQEVLIRFAGEIAAVNHLGVRVGLVLGGGNIFRGLAGATQGMERSRADGMGMLATIINALAMEDALERVGCEARVLTAVQMDKVAEYYTRRAAMAHLDAGRVCIFAGGTGNPFFSTDSGAALRAAEIGAQVLLKATKVDGIYDRDPALYPDARRIEQLSYLEVIERGLRVMDLTAVSLCRDSGIPMVVFDAGVESNLLMAVSGERVGTLVTAG